MSKYLLLRIAVATATAAALAAPAGARAATFHVAPDGSDAADGSAAAPFRTIGQAVVAARVNDTIMVAPGRYREQVSLKTGDSGVSIIGETGSGERPVVDGEGTRQYGFANVGADDLTISGFEITGQTGAGVTTRGSRDVISGNVIHHIGATGAAGSYGVWVGWGSDTRVTGNVIHSIGPAGESRGIWLTQTSRAVVAGNTVYLVRQDGVRDWQGLDNTITGNRIFLCSVGIAFNTSTGSVATNNELYDDTEGFTPKHLSYSTVLNYWHLTTPHWSRFWHNTIYRSTESSVWIAQSDQPLDYLDVRDNVFDGAGTAYVRDRPDLRGPHVVVDGNAYASTAGARAPAAVYKAGWTSEPGVSSWDAFRTQTGWETHGLQLDPALRDPAAGDLDYGDDSPAAAGSLDLGDALGRQLGARGLGPSPVRWTPYPMTPVASSSPGSWWTLRHLGDTVDGDLSTGWLSSTPADEYVTFDFGRQRTFDHLVLTLFRHADPRNPHGYRFEVSDDGVSWRTVLEGQNPDSDGSAYKYELAQPATARYLRYTMVDTFCKTYTPRTGCGEYFVLSDLVAGSVSGDAQAAAGPVAVPPPAGVVSTTAAAQPARTPASAPKAAAPAPKPAAAPQPAAKKPAAARKKAAAAPKKGAPAPKKTVTKSKSKSKRKRRRATCSTRARRAKGARRRTTCAASRAGKVSRTARSRQLRRR